MAGIAPFARWSAMVLRRPFWVRARLGCSLVGCDEIPWCHLNTSSSPPDRSCREIVLDLQRFPPEAADDQMPKANRQAVASRTTTRCAKQDSEYASPLRLGNDCCC